VSCLDGTAIVVVVKDEWDRKVYATQAPKLANQRVARLWAHLTASSRERCFLHLILRWDKTCDGEGVTITESRNGFWPPVVAVSQRAVHQANRMPKNYPNLAHTIPTLRTYVKQRTSAFQAYTNFPISCLHHPNQSNPALPINTHSASAPYCHATHRPYPHPRWNIKRRTKPASQSRNSAVLHFFPKPWPCSPPSQKLFQSHDRPF